VLRFRRPYSLAAYRAAPALPAEASTLPPAANDVPLIDQAEALLLELAAIIPQLSDRDVCNVGHNLDVMYRASEAGAEAFTEVLADDPMLIGEGQRICDVMDREEALEAEAVERLEGAYACLKGLPRPLTHAVLMAAVNELLAVRARVEADLIARHGEEGRRAFEHAEREYSARLDREWKARQAA
jgi:hypothetical protein